jgi:hypothetical protein
MTGGPVLKSGKSDAAAKLAGLIDELRGRYTLGYRPSVSRPPGVFCSIHLDFAPQAHTAHPDLRDKDIAIRTKRGYYR